MLETCSKPVLIIGCSDSKVSFPAKASNLYQGPIYKTLRSNLGDNFFEYFEVFILSGGHGLISGDTILVPYDKPMYKLIKRNESAINQYCEKHSSTTISLLKAIPNKAEREVFCFLTNNYMGVFKKLLHGTKFDSFWTSFKSHYICEGHEGIGELLGRLKKLCISVKSPAQSLPTVFRSGISNRTETAYISAGCCGGSSLAHTNLNKNRDLLAELLDSLKFGALFLDNGLISKLTSNTKMDSNWVFTQYEKIVEKLPRKLAKNLYIVIPDSVDDPAEAERIVVQHKKQIIKLSRKANLILPIHRSEDIRKNTRVLLKHLKYAELVLGVPCLTKPGLDLALSTRDIDALFSMNKPNGEPCFRRVHFLGMSEVSTKNKLNPRLLLAKLHSVQVTMDTNRTPAIFGYNKKGLRKGSKMAEVISLEFLKPQVSKNEKYSNHSFHTEFIKPDSEPFVTQSFYDLIEENVFAWWDIYNKIMDNHPTLQFHSMFSEDEEEEAKYMAWQISSQACIDHLIFEELKERNWAEFRFLISDSIEELSPFEKRYRAIQALFDQPNRQPYQMTMKLT
ncbi:hypothetical protein HUO09_17905 [Vibrio sp. Y2-5]|uniref:DUF6884 domain-containing protein n=1 Tax=Vibrio sp. Y2-5 TaxID=2743977 RepID=UPI0016617960|nr:DUF6884 domain-containing protein [Vibrio sp. Y2-5]MBD0788234.1 hypothetical protein [Vibrio sp. Y2-5]